MDATLRPNRTLLWTGRALSVLGFSLVFVAALALGVVLHLDLPVGRRITAQTIATLLSNFFQGTITIGRIDELTAYSLTARNLEVYDVQGRNVLKLDELRAKANLLEILRQVLLSPDRVEIVIRHARVENAETQLLPDPDPEVAAPSIVNAFTPVPGPPDDPNAPPGREVRLWMPIVEIGRAYGRGTIAGSPTLEAQVAGVRGSVLTGRDGVAVDIGRFGTVIRGIGGSDATGTATVHVRAPSSFWWTFDGQIAGIGVGTFMRMDRSRMTITADIPRAQPEQMKVVLPGWPIERPIAAHLEATGESPVLETKSRFTIGQTQLYASGPFRMSGNVGLELDVRGHDVDIRALWPKMPETHIDVETAVNVFGREGDTIVDVNGTTQATEIAGQAVPPIDVAGTYTRAGFDGKATLHEPGMPTKVDFTVTPEGVIDLKARARRFGIQRAPRLRGLTDARGELDVSVEAHIEKEQLQARVTADAAQLQAGAVKLASARVSGRVRGPLAEPRRLTIDTQLTGRQLNAGQFSFEQVKGSARGPVLSPQVKLDLEDAYGPSFTVAGTLLTEQGPRGKNLELEVRRNDVKLGGRLAALDLSGGSVVIDELDLKGAGGSLAGSVRFQPNLLEANIQGEDLDLDALSRLLGLTPGLVGGRARISADVSAGRDVQRGRVFVALGNATFKTLSGISLRMNASLDDEAFRGDVSGQVQDVAAFGAAWDGRLGGHVTQPSSWRDIIGAAEVQLDRVELSNLLYFLPQSARVQELRGHGYARARVERRIPAALPTVLLEAIGTQGLEVVRRPDPSDAIRSLPLRNYQLLGHGELNGETGAASFSGLLMHQSDILAATSVSSQLDLQRAVKAPDQLRAQLFETPLNAVLSIPEHNLERLPPELKPATFSGIFAGRAALTGSLAAPRIGATLDAKNVVVLGSELTTPVNLQANAEYDKASGRFGGEAQIFQDRTRVASFTTAGAADWHALFSDQPQGTRPAWTGSARMTLSGLPVQVLPPVAESRVIGRTFGSFELERRGLLPNITADVEIRDTSVDTVPVGTGQLTARSDGKLLGTRLRFDSRRGNLDARLRAALTWNGIIPGVDATQPMQIDVQARSFDSVLLQPVLSGTLTELQGRINADVAARLTQQPDPSRPGAQRWNADIRGTGNMNDGSISMASLGLELRDVDFNARATNTGRVTTIRIPDLTARARSDSKNLKADIIVVLDGLRVAQSTSSVSITGRMPLLIQGVTQAFVTGNATVVMTRKPEIMEVAVDLANVRAVLPRASGRSLIPIEDNEDIQVLQPLREPIVDPEGDALPWHIVFNLGNDVLVQRNDMTIPVAGRPELHIGAEVSVGGRLELNAPGRVGRLTLFGKSFEIEQGEIVFDTGENDNPRVDITARSRTPDGSLVFVDMYGPWKETTIAFRSEPPTADPLNLLLAGPSASLADTDASGAAAAAGVGGVVGGTAFQALFGDTPLSSVVEFRSSTNETADKASYTAAVRVSEKIWFEGTYRMRDLNQSSNTPNTEDTDVSGTLDWRFRPRWSLRTEIGTLGAGLDLLWQYRY